MIRGRQGSDRGHARTKVLAVLVGIMITAAVVALLLITFSDKSTKSGHSEPKQVAAGKSVGASFTPATSLPAPSGSSTTAAPVTSSTPPRRAATPATTPSRSVGGVAASRPPAARKPITYVVRRGDNLTVIAAWFHQHGYGPLYEWNRAVIGDNPNLIFPGQRITISGATMTVSR